MNFRSTLTTIAVKLEAFYELGAKTDCNVFQTGDIQTISRDQGKDNSMLDGGFINIVDAIVGEAATSCPKECVGSYHFSYPKGIYEL